MISVNDSNEDLKTFSHKTIFESSIIKRLHIDDCKVCSTNAACKAKGFHHLHLLFGSCVQSWHLDLHQRELGLHVIPIIIITHPLPPCTVRVTFDICCSNCSMLCLFEAYYVSLLCPRLDVCFRFQLMCKTTYTEYGFPVPFTLFLCTHQWFAPGWGGGRQPQGNLTFLR